MYSKSFSCLLFLWRVKFLAEFTFSSQWLHMKCFDLAVICVILHASSFLDYFHYVCLQWLHVYWFSYNCIESCEQKFSTYYYFSNKVYLSIFGHFFKCLFLICFIKSVYSVCHLQQWQCYSLILWTLYILL